MLTLRLTTSNMCSKLPLTANACLLKRTESVVKQSPVAGSADHGGL